MPPILISLTSFGAAETRRHGQLWFTTLAHAAGELKLREHFLSPLGVKRFAKALQMLGDFHQGKATAQDTLAALQQHLEAAAWHHCNVAQHATPELDFEA